MKFLSNNDLVDDDFIQKGLFDIVSGYSKLSILTDTDQTQHVINLDNDIRNGVYKDAGKEIRQDALVATFNEEGVSIEWDGMSVKVGPEPTIVKKPFSKSKLVRKN